MMRIGITGSDGFIGTAFRRYLTALGEPCVGFPRTAFERPEIMSAFLAECDAVVHFAGMSRHPDGALLYETNVRLTEALIAGLREKRSAIHVYFASTTHEQRDLPYHQSKRRSRQLLENWAADSGNSCTTLLMPNTFGPWARPFFNSAVSTFCFLAAHDRTPEQIDPAELKLIHVRTLCREIRQIIRNDPPGVTAAVIPHEHEVRLDVLWQNLTAWQAQLKAGVKPLGRNAFETDLLETFLSYRG